MFNCPLAGSEQMKEHERTGSPLKKGLCLSPSRVALTTTPPYAHTHTHTCTPRAGLWELSGETCGKAKFGPQHNECLEVRIGDGPLGTGVKNREVQSWKLPGGGSEGRGKGGFRGGPRL